MGNIIFTGNLGWDDNSRDNNEGQMKTILIVMGILYVVLFLLFMGGAGKLNKEGEL